MSQPTFAALAFANKKKKTRREEFLELAAIEPDAVAIGAGVDNDRAVDGAIDTQQPRSIARAVAFSSGGFIDRRAFQQTRHLVCLFREQLTEFVVVKPGTVALGAAVDGYFVHSKFDQRFALAFWALHSRLLATCNERIKIGECKGSPLSVGILARLGNLQVLI
jgi:hypothetical protein